MKQYLLFTSFLVFMTLQLSSQSLEFIIQQQLNSTANEFSLSAQDVSEWSITDNHVSKNSNVRHLYIRQQYQGIEIIGANASLHLMQDKKNASPLSYHNNFQPNAAANINQANASATPQLKAAEAVATAAKRLGYHITDPIEVIKVLDNSGNRVLLSKGGISLENIPVKLVYQADTNGNLKLAWDFSILELNHANWWSIRVDAQSGQVLDKNNWTLSCSFKKTDECQEETNLNHQHHLNIPKPNNTNHTSSMVAGYNVYAVPVESPNHGTRTIVSDPSDAIASPYGWHDDNGAAGAEYTITRGNNVHAQEDRNGNNGTGYSPDGGTSLTFDYPIDLNLEPINNEDAMITNLFYWNNIIHDVAYRLGFDEASGNFQENNYGNGGFGSDYVYADAQDGSGSNNANFSTPPDGSNPRMQMFLWTAPTPDIDGDLDNGIILHEYGHGISIRLTGGASNSGCLNNTEQMGEGWSDYWGVMLSMKATDQGPDKRGVGTYALNQPTTGNGIRTYPYSTDMTINPHTYDDISGLTAPHGVGSLWCAMIWEMSWELIEEHGFDEDIYQGTGGNNIAMQLVLEGMKLQPCSPGFIDGRDAILKADTALYAGANSCLIWRAFAKRGLGYSADQGSSSSKTDGTEAFDLPPGVNENCITTPDYAIVINPNRKSACAGSDFVYDVSVLAFNGYTGTVTISDNVFPAGTNSNLAETTFSSFPATTTWTISNTSGIAEGDHLLTINGTDGTIAHDKSGTLEILPVADAPTLVAPANNSTVSSLNQTLSWNTATGATHYDLQIATDAAFNTIILDVSTITGTSYASGLLSPNTTYFWRVKSNSCATSSYNVFSFSTISSCGQTFTDSGGANGNYENNEFQEWIFCPDNVGDAVIVNFTSFELETAGSTSCWDDLTIYNGNSTSAPSLGAFCGTSPDDLPNGGLISATNESGCLTFVFDSDGSVLRSGWVATISCADCLVPVVNTINTTPENCGSNDGNITVTASAFNPVEYVLTPIGGSEIINTTGVFSNLSAGDYQIVLRTQGDADCASSPQSITLTAITPTINTLNIINESCNEVADGSVTITSNFSGSLDYLLTPTGGTTIINATGVFTGLTTGSYSVAIRPSGDNLCASPDSSITINTTIIAPLTVTDFEICLTDIPASGEGLTATCSGDICDAITVEPNSAINASNTTVCETISVSGNTQPVSEIYLSMKVQHTWVGDLSATLQSPDGTVISLFNGPGIPASSWGCHQNNLNLIFADTASMTAEELENMCNPSSGTTTYAIEGAFQSIDLFSTLNGETANGDWTICFYDSYTSLDHGVVESITLIVNPAPSVITWWDAPTNGNMLYTGDTFDPVNTGTVDPNQVGTHTFYAQCECAGCPSSRTVATFDVSGSYYFLDNDMDGYGDANTSTVVCSGETPPSNYVSNFTDCDDTYDGDIMIIINDHPVDVEMHQANAMITSEGTVEPNANLVTFQAGDVISLMPGFHAMAGSNFLAKIDSCGQHPLATLVVDNSSISRQNQNNLPSNISNISLKIYPNPFISSTQIIFQLPQEEKIALSIYDNFGRLIETYYDGDWQAAGRYQVTFDSGDLTTGLFIAVLRTEKSVVSQRIVLAR